MNGNNNFEKYINLTSKLKIDCASCSGLCCVALYCMKTDGFPEDKEAGIPCKNLMPNFHCATHGKLAKDKMRGCMAYDCFGAGQMVTQICYPDQNWRTSPNRANEIFQVFLTIFQLHQMLWYLIEAMSAVSESHLAPDIEALIVKNEQMTSLCPDEILSLDIEKHRLDVNQILKKVIKRIAVYPAKPNARSFFYA